MDSIPKNYQLCSKHSQKKIKYIKINDLQNSEHNNTFYCSSCVNFDFDFKSINYLLISQIINEGENSIIQKWPPINDYSIIDRLYYMTKQQNSSLEYIETLNDHFNTFKLEFLKRIDQCQKQMNIRAQEIIEQKSSIIKQYQEISQISSLRALLIESQEKSVKEYEESYKEFAISIESKKEENTQLLSDLLKQCSEGQQQINFQYIDFIQKSIFSLFEALDFIKSQEITNTNKLHQKNEVKKDSKVSMLISLISNKSNYCSQNFLSQLEETLDKINPLLKDLSFENIHEQGQQPMNFRRLNETRMCLIRNYIDHWIQIDQNQHYLSSIKLAQEYKYMSDLIDSNVNFMNKELKLKLKQLIIDSYPLLKQISFENTTISKDKFDFYRQLPETDSEDIYQLIKKRAELTKSCQYKISLTKQIIKIIHQSKIQFHDDNLLLTKYPIFELMKRLELKDILNDIRLTKTSYQDGINRSIISTFEHAVYISSEKYFGKFCNNDWINCVSNITLYKNYKYIFRFKIESIRNDAALLAIGLVEKNKTDVYPGFQSRYSCYLQNKNSKDKLIGGYGIDKFIKGNKLKLYKKNQLEMRVHLQEKVVQVLDFPSYKNQVSISESSKVMLPLDNMLLYIGLCKEKISVTLTSAFTVDLFPN